MSDVNEQVRQEVATLRAQGLTPKSIARQLKLRPAEVSTIIREQAEALAKAVPESGLRPIVACYVSAGWKKGLILEATAENWPDREGTEGHDGMVTVLIAREDRYGKVAVCTYLVDVYCLGVKNSIGPRVMEKHELDTFVRRIFKNFGDPVPAPIGLAQNLVLGAVEYARSLGFQTRASADFDKSQPFLGEWSGPGAIRFGKDGKPEFVNGPDDDVYSILATLDRNVGKGNYNAVIMSGPPPY